MADKAYRIIQGDSAQELKHIADNTIDAVVTDPPYGIEFLGKDWDSHTGAIEIWQQCLRILKPGGYLLAFSAARTYHHLTTNIESVGFEIRDQLMWIYSSGFPKAQDLGKALDKRGQNNNWHGWKTALKPGHEPIVMARKPFRGSTIDNIQQWGVGALNIDHSRIPYQDQADLNTYINNIAGPLERSTAQAGTGIGMHEGKTGFRVQKGRVKRPQAGHRTASFSFGDKEPQPGGDGSPQFEAHPQGRFPSNVLGEIPDYQKYFYCPKVTRRERHCGFENTAIPNPLSHRPEQSFDALTDSAPMGSRRCSKDSHERWHQDMAHKKGHTADPLAHIPTNPEEMLDHNGGTRHIDGGNKQPAVGNNHPTVKPVALMRYLIELITPANSHIVDPFAGSGTTGMAATELGHRFTGIEQDPNYVEIARRRIEGWLNTATAKKNTVKHSTAKQHTDPAKTHTFDRWFE